MITIIVAMTDHRIIGKDNDIPWHIPEDLKLFKKLTSGHTVIMGRKTFDSLPMSGGLPNRKNIVVTRGDFPEDIPEGVCYVDDLEALLKAYRNASEEVYVIGGAKVYEQALSYADKISLSVVRTDYDGDTKFPEINYDEWNMGTDTCKSYDEFDHYIMTRK